MRYCYINNCMIYVSNFGYGGWYFSTITVKCKFWCFVTLQHTGCPMANWIFSFDYDRQKYASQIWFEGGFEYLRRQQFFVHNFCSKLFTFCCMKKSWRDQAQVNQRNHIIFVCPIISFKAKIQYSKIQVQTMLALKAFNFLEFTKKNP